VGNYSGTKQAEEDLMENDQIEEYELRGYQRGTCPRCHSTIWSDSGLESCDRCGYNGVSDGVSDVTVTPEKDEKDEWTSDVPF
jgi:ribosomal protein L37AE/L43A